MSQETTLVEDTDPSQNSQAAPSRVYTQEEVDNMIAGMKANLQKRLLKPYEGLGDPAELRALREQAERQQQEQAMKRGEFEKLLQEKAQKWESEIQKRDQIITQYKVDTPLVSAAAELRAVNPEQVRKLLRDRVRLNEEGEVEVTDERGQVLYSDAGHPKQVRDLVAEFLDTNPHFAQPAATTASTRSSMRAPQPIDMSKLDMRLAEHRRIYADMKATKKR